MPKGGIQDGELLERLGVFYGEAQVAEIAREMAEAAADVAGAGCAGCAG